LTVAAVVVRWRGGDEVDRCLRSLLAQTGGALSKIVLVDSGSADGGAARLEAAFPEIRMLALEENRSFAHAANAGAATVDDELLLLLNPDTEVEPNVVSTLAETAGNHPEAAGVVPLLVNPDGSSQHQWQLRRLPTVGQLAAGRPGGPAFGSPPISTVSVEQPAAAAWLVRREVWQALGGLDEAYAPAWWEDADFCARLAGRVDDPTFLARQGFVVAPGAVVRHQGGSSLNELDPAAFLEMFNTNLLRYAARHHPDRLRFIRSGLRLSLLARAMLRPARFRAHMTARRRI